MPRSLFVSGWQITPIIHAVDIADQTVEQFSAGSDTVAAKDIDTFWSETWPARWADITRQFDEAEANADNARVDAGRAARVAARPARKKTTKRTAKKAT